MEINKHVRSIWEIKFLQETAILSFFCTGWIRHFIWQLYFGNRIEPTGLKCSYLDHFWKPPDGMHRWLNCCNITFLFVLSAAILTLYLNSFFFCLSYKSPIQHTQIRSTNEPGIHATCCRVGFRASGDDSRYKWQELISILVSYVKTCKDSWVW